VDVFDAAALRRAVIEAKPQIVIHQLTDLPPGLDPARMAEATVRNARIRIEGTKNLIAAALAAGARRLIAQSIAWEPQGVSAEGVVLPCVVRRPGVRAAPATERADPRVAHAARTQRSLERRRAELRQASRPGKAANIHDRLDLVRGERGEEFLGRPRGVADRPDSHPYASSSIFAAKSVQEIRFRRCRPPPFQ